MKERLDVLLTGRKLTESREKAKALIMSGIVYVNGVREDKAGASFPDDVSIEIRGEKLKYVSRGGLKLEKAIRVFAVAPAGKICMDVGASTGGFTDCMLQNGACRVYAIDVGHGQFDWRLRNDPRVVCLEKTNIRYVTHELVPDEIALSSIDVSFISLSRVLPAVRGLLKPGGEVVALIKPQFEAGREKVGKHGVVRDRLVHEEVIRNAFRYAHENAFSVRNLTWSPIRGPEGNIEYLYDLSAGTAGEPAGAEYPADRIRETVDAAHEELDPKGDPS